MAAGTALAKALPTATPTPVLDRLAETARGYARAAHSANTNRAYASDWRGFADWASRRGAEIDPPSPETVGLWLTALATGAEGAAGRPLGVSTIERKVSAIVWRCAQRGRPFDRADRHVATVLAGIRRRHARPPRAKEAILADDLKAMLALLPPVDLRALRDRALLLVGFAGALRRSEIVGLDIGPEQTVDGKGWIDLRKDGAILSIAAKTGWREVEVARGSSPDTCPVAALEKWI
ncbi:MAG: integrase, partial [Hyphomicrobiales bacterium]|nr:integrase [Hyphomicrobiales bacterium]